MEKKSRAGATGKKSQEPQPLKNYPAPHPDFRYLVYYLSSVENMREGFHILPVIKVQLKNNCLLFSPFFGLRHVPLNARVSGYLDLKLSICPFLHYFHDVGLRSGFFVVPLFIPFW